MRSYTSPLNSPAADATYSGALSPKVGTPGPNDGNKITAINDGTSNTLFFTEIAGRGLNIYIKGRSVVLVDDGIVKQFNLEEPGGFGASSGDTLLKQI